MIQASLRRWPVFALPVLVILAVTSSAHGYAVVVPDDFPTLQAAFDSLEFHREIDTIYVSQGVVEDTVTATIHSKIAIVGLGDSLTRPQVGVMHIGEVSYYLVTLSNLRFTGEFRTVGKANILFESCRIEGGLVSPIQGSLRELEFRDCDVTSRMRFEFDSFVTVDSCRFEGGALRFEDDARLELSHCTFIGPSAEPAIEGTDIGTLEIAHTRIVRYAYGILQSGSGGTLTAVSNHIEGCGTGFYSRSESSVADNTILNSTNDGMVCLDQGASVQVERNVVLRSGGRGIWIEGYVHPSVSRIVSNTIVGNHDAGLELQFPPSNETTAVIANNIGYDNAVGLRVHGAADADLQISCNNWFANDSAAVVGVSPSATDLFLDPQFCDLERNDVHLVDSSPLLEAAGCGLIGALGVGCANTATLVTVFTADRTTDGIRVTWRLADASQFHDVLIERSESKWSPWVRIVAVSIREGESNTVLDRSARADRSYAYRLVAMEQGQTLVLSEPIEVAPITFALGRVTPNPTSGPLHIRFALPHEAQIEIDVFDVTGRHVSRLAYGLHQAGPHTIEWSGAGDSKPGMYLVRYRFPGGEVTRSFMRLR